MDDKNPKVKIVHLQSDLTKAIRIIGKFFKLNDIKIKYTLVLDYKLDSFGIFYPNKKFEITINPSQFHDTSLEETHQLYYSTDFSITSVAIHEMSHLLDQHFGILDLYKKKFKDKLILNENSERDKAEEVAEIFRLFFLNPFFLKLISPDRYDFFKELFQSPSSCTKRNFISKWKTWNPQIH